MSVVHTQPIGACVTTTDGLTVCKGRVLRSVVGDWYVCVLPPRGFQESFRRLADCIEGVDFVFGHHAEGSEPVLAMLAAKALIA